MHGYPLYDLSMFIGKYCIEHLIGTFGKSNSETVEMWLPHTTTSAINTIKIKLSFKVCIFRLFYMDKFIFFFSKNKIIGEKLSQAKSQ